MAEQDQKIQCDRCGGTEIYATVLSARNGVIIGRKARTGDEWILVHCFICLTCGSVMPYLDVPGLERLRTWAYDSVPAAEAPASLSTQSNPAPVDTGAPSATAGDGSPLAQDAGRGFGTIVILCIIIGALLGIMGAVYGLMHE